MQILFKTFQQTVLTFLLLVTVLPASISQASRLSISINSLTTNLNGQAIRSGSDVFATRIYF